MKTLIEFILIAIIVTLVIMMNSALAATTSINVMPSAIQELNMAKEIKKCQCKCKRRTNMSDLMDAKEFLDRQLQEMEAQPEQRMN